MSRYKWRDCDMTCFLRLYRRNACLWNNRLQDYKDKNKREDALERMRNQLGLPVTVADIKIKIKGLRTTYGLERYKILKSIQAGEDPVYKPKLFWFDYANEFLYEVTEVRDRDSWGKDTRVLEPETTWDDKQTYEEVHDNDNDKITNYYPASYDKDMTPRYKPPNVMENEFELFGRSVGVHLRKMPLPDSLECQQEIQSIINKYRIRAMAAPKIQPRASNITVSSSKGDPIGSVKYELNEYEEVEEDRIDGLDTEVLYLEENEDETVVAVSSIVIPEVPSKRKKI